MKPKQLFLLIVASFAGVSLSAAAPMDLPVAEQAPANQNIDQMDIDVEDLVPTASETIVPVAPTPEGFFVGLPDDVLRTIGDHLAITDSANFARSSNHYRKALKNTNQSPDAYFGSEDKYVTDVKYCDSFSENPDKKKSIKYIYVTSDVFIKCQFNPADFPKLRNINIQFVRHNPNAEHSTNSFNLLEDTGLIAFKNREWGPDDAFEINSESTTIFGRKFGLEHQAIEEQELNWVEFLLNHRDWGKLADPFDFWDFMLWKAVHHSFPDAIPVLFQFAKDKPFLQGRYPYSLEFAVKKGPVYYERFRGHVNEQFLNGLITVQNCDVQGVRAWLNNGNPTSEQISRAMKNHLTNADASEQDASFTAITTLLAYDDRFDVKYRDEKNEPLIIYAIRKNLEHAFDVLISKEGIEVNRPLEISYTTTNEAMGEYLDVPRFKRLLEKGAYTFLFRDPLHGPLITALRSESKREYAEAIIDRRTILKSDGTLEVLLDEFENETVFHSRMLQELTMGLPIRVVTRDDVVSP